MNIPTIIRTKKNDKLFASRRKTGKLVPCDGEAHSNAFIDHCFDCAPRWGQKEEVKFLSEDEMHAALSSGQVVPFSEMTEAAFETAYGLMRAKTDYIECKVHERSRGRRLSYQAVCKATALSSFLGSRA